MKAKNLIIIIAAIAAYLFGCLYLIHVMWVLKEGAVLSEALGLGFLDMFRQPFDILPLPEGALLAILLITMIGAALFLMVWSNTSLKKHYNSETIQGAGKYLKGKELDEFKKKFSEPFGKVSTDGKNNMILSRDIFLSMNSRAIDRNLHTLLIGGSGSGKSFRVVTPNILQCNCSMLINDPSGSLLDSYGCFLEAQGYKVKVFNLSHMDKGNHYNPFRYVLSDMDVSILVNTIMTNTTPPEKKAGDPFWEHAESMFLNAIIAFLYKHVAEEDQTFGSIMDLTRAAEIEEEGSGGRQSPLDKLFYNYATDHESFEYVQYKNFKLGAAKTMKSILTSVAARLRVFDQSAVRELTNTDDIDLDMIGDEKTALFIVLPTADTTFGFIASMMYSQLFQRLYDYCENFAEFSQLLVDSDGEVIRTIRSKNEDESKVAAANMAEYLERIRQSDTVIKFNEKTHLYEIRTAKDELVAFRGKKEDAENALEKIRNGRVRANSEIEDGKHTPIPVRLILDEFANTGKIPDFEQIVSTMRKYWMSVVIVLQSLGQIKGLYEKRWSDIAGNCDTTIYLGGGNDTETGEWLTKLMGKETRRAMSTTYSGTNGGSQSFSDQGVDMFSTADMRKIAEDECLILIRGLDPYKGKKYNPLKHKNWDLAHSYPTYRFNPRKADDLKKEQIHIDEQTDLNEVKDHGEVDRSFEKTMIEENRSESVKAKEARNRADADGEVIIGSPAIPTEANDKPIRDVGLDRKEIEDGEFLETIDDLYHTVEYKAG